MPSPRKTPSSAFANKRNAVCGLKERILDVGKQVVFLLREDTRALGVHKKDDLIDSVLRLCDIRDVIARGANGRRLVDDDRTRVASRIIAVIRQLNVLGWL